MKRMVIFTLSVCILSMALYPMADAGNNENLFSFFFTMVGDDQEALALANLNLASTRSLPREIFDQLPDDSKLGDLNRAHEAALNTASTIKTVDFKGRAEILSVPLPIAIWLFGVALIGFVGLHRTRQQG